MATTIAWQTKAKHSNSKHLLPAVQAMSLALFVHSLLFPAIVYWNSLFVRQCFSLFLSARCFKIELFVPICQYFCMVYIAFHCSYLPGALNWTHLPVILCGLQFCQHCIAFHCSYLPVLLYGNAFHCSYLPGNLPCHDWKANTPHSQGGN